MMLNWCCKIEKKVPRLGYVFSCVFEFFGSKSCSVSAITSTTIYAKCFYCSTKIEIPRVYVSRWAQLMVFWTPKRKWLLINPGYTTIIYTLLKIVLSTLAYKRRDNALYGTFKSLLFDFCSANRINAINIINCCKVRSIPRLYHSRYVHIYCCEH